MPGQRIVCRRKIVVDSSSNDATISITTTHGAAVIHQPWFGFGAQRNFASTLARNEWILLLDADETLTPALCAELQAALPVLISSNQAAASIAARPNHGQTHALVPPDGTGTQDEYLSLSTRQMVKR